MSKMTTIEITDAKGTTADCRPGHTVSGLLFYLDPFQRQDRVRLDRVASAIMNTAVGYAASIGIRGWRFAR